MSWSGARGMRSVPSDMRRNSSPSGWATSAACSRRARRPITVYITWLEPPLQFREVSMCSENITQLPTPTPNANPRPNAQRWELGVGGGWALGVGRWELFCSSQSLANFRNTEYEFISEIVRPTVPSRKPRRSSSSAGTPRAVRDERQRSGALTALVHLPRGERRVVVDAIELIAQVAKRVVLKLVDELTGAAVHGDRFVDVEPGPPRRPAVVEPGLDNPDRSPSSGPSVRGGTRREARDSPCAAARWRAARGSREASAGGIRSSASSEKIQSFEARLCAKFF